MRGRDTTLQRLRGVHRRGDERRHLALAGRADAEGAAARAHPRLESQHLCAQWRAVGEEADDR